MTMLIMELMKIYFFSAISQYIITKENLNNNLRELVYNNVTINIIKFY